MKSQKRRSFQLISVSILLDFLMLVDGTHRLSRNVTKELPLNAVYYLRRAEISHDNLVMQTMVWL